jgi:hypothetical protein
MELNSKTLSPLERILPEICDTFFPFLTRTDTANCSSVSKEFAAITEFAWEKICKKIGICNVENFRIALSQKVFELKKIGDEGTLLLQKPVKTGDEFDMFFMRFERRNNEEGINSLVKELNEKIGLKEKIICGFNAKLQLKRIQCASLQELKAFAAVLEEKYGDNKPYVVIANHLIDENYVEDAIIILNLNLKDSIRKGSIIQKIIFKYVNQKDVESAIEFLKKQNYSSDDSDVEDAIQYLFAYCYENEKFETIEQLIDNVKMKDKVAQILILLSAYLKKNNKSKAKELLVKYDSLLESAKKGWNAEKLVDVLVKLDHVKEAWSITLANRDSNRFIIFTLHNALLQVGLFEEAEKAKALIG